MENIGDFGFLILSVESDPWPLFFTDSSRLVDGEQLTMNKDSVLIFSIDDFRLITSDVDGFGISPFTLSPDVFVDVLFGVTAPSDLAAKIKADESLSPLVGDEPLFLVFEDIDGEPFDLTSTFVDDETDGAGFDGAFVT